MKHVDLIINSFNLRAMKNYILNHFDVQDNVFAMHEVKIHGYQVKVGNKALTSQQI